MKNVEVAGQFDLMADLLEIRGENLFRIRAYRRAALNLQSLTEGVEILAREQRLDEIPGHRCRPRREDHGVPRITRARR